MAHEDKIPQFSERVREQLALRRVLVLDGVLDDDNGLKECLKQTGP